MQFPRFIDAVSRRSGLAPEQAATVARAVLQTMAERVTGGESDDLAGQLPDELDGYLGAGAGPAQSASGPAEFLRRVGERAGIDEVAARAGTAAVFATLRETVTVGEFQQMVTRLPRGADGGIEPTPPAPYDG
ncbi:DUF2267 domain-containing protein [Micromonospora sp. NPDC094482]|uniref:DUF2267 domain-containing protein n=1 Tax=unclassified Micromonospora TaxID=2617518 RepID=UPI003319C7A4